MAVVHEEFIRCSCGCADFKEETVVTLPKGLQPRYINERETPQPALERTINYYCAACGTKLNV
jgi:hypothetical protein